jgi:hypothetical protein
VSSIVILRYLRANGCGSLGCVSLGLERERFNASAILQAATEGGQRLRSLRRLVHQLVELVNFDDEGHVFAKGSANSE